MWYHLCTRCSKSTQSENVVGALIVPVDPMIREWANQRETKVQELSEIRELVIYGNKENG
jgi:hypothetical protein